MPGDNVVGENIHDIAQCHLARVRGRLQLSRPREQAGISLLLQGKALVAMLREQRFLISEVLRHVPQQCVQRRFD
jgi:hypothetical protein